MVEFCREVFDYDLGEDADWGFGDEALGDGGLVFWVFLFIIWTSCKSSMEEEESSWIEDMERVRRSGVMRDL